MPLLVHKTFWLMSKLFSATSRVLAKATNMLPPWSFQGPARLQRNFSQLRVAFNQNKIFCVSSSRAQILTGTVIGHHRWDLIEFMISGVVMYFLMRGHFFLPPSFTLNKLAASRATLLRQCFRHRDDCIHDGKLIPLNDYQWCFRFCLLAPSAIVQHLINLRKASILKPRPAPFLALFSMKWRRHYNLINLLHIESYLRNEREWTSLEFNSLAPTPAPSTGSGDLSWTTRFVRVLLILPSFV